MISFRHRILLVALATLSVAAVFAIHHIEAAGSAIGQPQLAAAFSPNGDRRLDTAQLTFHLRRAGTVSVWVEDHHGDTVRTLWHDHHARRGPVRLSWDGRDGHGHVQPDGTYRVYVHVGGGRTYRLHRPVRLDTEPPAAGTLRLLPRTAHEPPGTFRMQATVDAPHRIAVLVLGGRARFVVLHWERHTNHGHTTLTWTLQRPTLALLRSAGSAPHVTLVTRDEAGNVAANTLDFDRVVPCPDGTDGVLTGPVGSTGRCA